MKGILFKDWKIKAIAEDDREWQTRRLGGLKEINENPDDWETPIKVVNDTYPAKSGDWLFQHKTQLTLCVIARPRYQVGETVYIKEAWRAGIRGDEAYLTLYKDGSSKLGLCGPAAHRFAHYASKWQSPLFMPEWAARRFIKFTGVGAGRVQEITPEDCVVEGYPFGAIPTGQSITQLQISQLMRIGWYRTLWDSINPKYPWAMNPWVFVYSFKRVEAEK